MGCRDICLSVLCLLMIQFSTGYVCPSYPEVYYPNEYFDYSLPALGSSYTNVNGYIANDIIDVYDNYDYSDIVEVPYRRSIEIEPNGEYNIVPVSGRFTSAGYFGRGTSSLTPLYSTSKFNSGSNYPISQMLDDIVTLYDVWNAKPMANVANVFDDRVGEELNCNSGFVGSVPVSGKVQIAVKF